MHCITGERYYAVFFCTEQSISTAADGSLTERGNTIIKQTPFKRLAHLKNLPVH